MDEQQRGPAAPSPRALELLDHTREAFTALRRAHAHLLDVVHLLEVEDVAEECGYPSTSRLLQDHARLDRGETTVLRRHARLLHPTPQPSGHQTPPALPATATALARGAISDGHVRVIATTITHLAGVAHIDTDTRDTTEQQLATLALDRSPAALADAAAEILARLDAEGTVPDDDVVPVDELHLLRRRDGSLHGKFHFRDPVSAEAVHTALHTATPAPTADGDPTATDEPAATDGPGATTAPARFADPDTLTRPIEQRRAQALRDLCTTNSGHSLDVDPDDQSVEGSETDEVGEVDEVDEVDGLVEFYAPTDQYDIDEHPRPTADDTAPTSPDLNGHTAANTAASATDPAPTLTDDLAEILADPKALDSVLERTITALLDRTPTPPPTKKPRTLPPPTTSPGKRSPGARTEGGDRIHLAVTIDYDTLRTQLDQTTHTGQGAPPRLPGPGYLGSGTTISPETARRLACDADLIPMVLGSRSEPLDIGRKTRVVPTAIRRAITTRDRHCAFPGCHRRPTTCDAHHVKHWLHQGHTTTDNLCLLCSYHHTLIHHSQWTITMINGLPWFTPPTWLDHHQTPRHNRPWRTDPTPTCPA